MTSMPIANDTIDTKCLLFNFLLALNIVKSKEDEIA